jgi:uncharacterized protein (TIGR00299 family) protein
MRSLLVDAQAGISGDMFVAAAATLADCEDEIMALPRLLGLDDVQCHFSDVRRGSIGCRRFDVRCAAEGHSSMHRPLADIVRMIERGALEPEVRARAVRMFEKLGTVEANLHAIAIEDVHFHEVGAGDSIIDIVAAAVCIERLEVEAVFSTPVCVGSGLVETAHGQLPIPAPATERLLHGVPVVVGELPGEWTTPTGALILGELRAGFEWPLHVVTASSFGAGARNPVNRPNILRLRLADVSQEAVPSPSGDEVAELRCNLDDCSGEMLGADFIAELLEHGALDVVVYPVTMKKGRPGYVLEVLAEWRNADVLARHVLETTTTIGVRLRRVRRLTLERVSSRVETAFGEVEVKVVRLPSGQYRVSPEYESCRGLAASSGVPIHVVYAAALEAKLPEFNWEQH